MNTAPTASGASAARLCSLFTFQSLPPLRLASSAHRAFPASVCAPRMWSCVAPRRIRAGVALATNRPARAPTIPPLPPALLRPGDVSDARPAGLRPAPRQHPCCTLGGNNLSVAVVTASYASRGASLSHRCRPLRLGASYLRLWFACGFISPDMALIKSNLIASASGSINGTTFSRNRGGMYIRGRAVPVNPNTIRQQDARNRLGVAVHDWREVLTSSERSSWNTYAQDTPLTNALGDPLILSGQQMYVRINTLRAQLGIAPLVTAPATAGGATPPTTPLALTLVADTAGLTGTVTVPGAGTNGWLGVWLSRPVSPSKTPAHEPYRYAGVETPPVADDFTVSIALAAIPWGLVAGQVVRAKLIFVGNDGKVSEPAYQDLTVGE